MLSKIVSFLKHPAVMVAVTVLVVEYIDSRSNTVKDIVGAVPGVGAFVLNKKAA